MIFVASIVRIVIMYMAILQYKQKRINVYWLARDEADIAVWLTYPSITVSATFTNVPIRFWIMIGNASFEAYFKKSFLFSIYDFP